MKLGRVERPIRAPANRQQFGLLLLHISVLVVLIGALVSGLTGQKSAVQLAAGESVNLEALGFGGNFLRLDKFQIQYHEAFAATPKQISSQVSLLAHGRELKGVIRVNQPFKAAGLTIFQSGYGWQLKGALAAAGVQRDFSLMDRGLISLADETDLGLYFVPHFDPASGSLESKTRWPQNPHLACALTQNGELSAAEIIPAGKTKMVGDIMVTFSDYRPYSALAIKRDRGVKVVFAGFGLALAGIIMRYFPRTGRLIKAR